MDIRDRVMGDMPHGFLHKIAGIVPGFNGYMDRERRRDADKLLRTYLAHQYSTQRDRLTRVQQSLLRSGQLTGISEVDRLVGVLQRFIDRLNTATYGYSGLFDPVKVEAQDLDQLYAFDMALTSGVDDVSSAIGTIESSVTSESAKPALSAAEGTDVPAALSRLSSVLDDLNLRLNQRGDLLTTGRGLPPNDYNSLVNSLGGPGATGAANATAMPPPSAAGMASSAAPATSAPPQYASGTPSTGAPTVNTSGNEMARYPGGIDAGNTTPETPRYPSGGDAGVDTSGASTTDLTGGATDYGIKTASSPSPLPTDQGSDIAGGLSTGGAMDSGKDATNLPNTPVDRTQS
jgi:hypothetical protein